MSSTDSVTVSRHPVALVAAVMALCWMVVLFDGLDVFVYGAVLPKMLDDPTLGLDPRRAGEIGSYATFGMLIGALAAGTVADWAGRKNVIVACCGLFSVASGVCAAAPSLGVFGLGRLMAGFGLGGLLPTAIAQVAEYAPWGRSNLMIGVLMTAHHAGGILASALSLWLVESLGWRSLFWIGVAPLVIAVPLVTRFLPESLAFLVTHGRGDEAEVLARRHRVELAEFPAGMTPSAIRVDRWASLRSLFHNSLWLPTVLFWLASFGGLLLVYGVATWLPTMMRDSGYDLGSALGFLLVINLGGIVGMLLAGRIADRFGADRVSAVWFTFTAAGIYLLRIHMPLPLAYVVVFLTGLWLFSAQAMVYAAVAARFPTHSRGTAIGWSAGMGRFGAVFGPWIGGILVANDAQAWGFTVFAGTAVFGAIMIALTRAAGNLAMPSGSAARPGEAVAS